MKNSGAGIKVRSGVKAGGMTFQHNRKAAGVRVRAGVKSGGMNVNHNRAASTARACARATNVARL